MSEFERGIQEARTRQHHLYLLTFFLLLILAVVLVGALVSTRGTPIKILPIEAEEKGTVSVVDGYAISYDNVVYGLLGTSTITVRANGFREIRRQIEYAEQGENITVILTAIPGMLIASTTPARANTRWALDGDFLSIDEGLKRELEHGTYALRIDNPFFVVEERVIEIKRAEKQEIIVDLMPIDGKIEISSEPSNAKISVNGQSNGHTPNSIQIKGGEHSIVLEKEGYVSVKEMITLTNIKATAERNYRLKHIPSTLTFSVEPRGGELLLNGRKVNPSGSYAVNSNVKHTLTYILEGFHPLARTVILKGGMEKQINILLKPEVGDVEIHANPSADIYIDGIKAGKKSVAVSLSAIVHTVELRKAGYRTIQKSVTPSSAHKIVIRESLTPEHAARKAEAPREYKNSVGVELKLFEPGPFKMGAPRHQPGQRANEFEKNIVLKKPFYSSKQEITNAQFMTFRKDHTGPENQPVVSVTWLEAASYCNWLSKRENLSTFYEIDGSRLKAVNRKADGYRLLTEAEWEWLARKAGRKEQTIFPWGNDSVVPQMAGNIADESANGLTRYYVPNYNDGFTDAAPVSEFPAEMSGLFDLTGNVSEWVHDFYTLMPPEKGKVYVDPLGPGFGAGHVVKGANWRSGTRTLLRAAYRDGLANKKDDVGFRVGRYLYAEEVTNAD